MPLEEAREEVHEKPDRNGESLLRVRGLTARFTLNRGSFDVVKDVDFDLRRGEMVGLVGESGSGKSILCLSLVGLLPPAARITSGHVTLDGEDLLALDAAAMRRIRGRKIAMTLQDPATALNPLLTIGNQVAEAVAQREVPSRSNRREAILEALRTVRIPNPERRLRSYPHQLSGGMKQRVAAAIALAADASLLIADEPTTALDVTIQAQFLAEFQRLQRTRGLSIIFVTHDLAVAAAICDRIAVMYSGRIVEQGLSKRIFATPLHPYTRGMIDCLPVLGQHPVELPTIAGEPASPLARPTGCPFHPRCKQATERCRNEAPPVFHADSGHSAKCWEIRGHTEPINAT